MSTQKIPASLQALLQAPVAEGAPEKIPASLAALLKGPGTSRALQGDKAPGGFGEGDFGQALTAGAAGFKSNIARAAQTYGFDTGEYADKQARVADEASARIAAPQSFEQVQGVSDIPGYAKVLLGKSAAEMGGAMVGGAAGLMLGGPVGAALGAGAAMFPSGVGQATQAQIEQTGTYDPSISTAAGGAYAALGATVGPTAALARMGLKAAGTGLVQGAKAGALKGVLTEPIQEVGQTFATDIAPRAAVDAKYDLLGADAMSRVKEAAIGGLVLGGAAGTVTGAIEGRQLPAALAAPVAETKPAVTPEVKTDLLAPAGRTYDTPIMGEDLSGQTSFLPGFNSPDTGMVMTPVEGEAPTPIDTNTADLFSPENRIREAFNESGRAGAGMSPQELIDAQTGVSAPAAGISPAGMRNRLNEPVVNPATGEPMGTMGDIYEQVADDRKSPETIKAEQVAAQIASERGAVRQFLKENGFSPKTAAYKAAMKAGKMESVPAALKKEYEASGSNQERAGYVEELYFKLTGREIDAPTDVPVEGIVPEAKRDIDAQLAAIVDDTSGKDTMLVTKGDPVPATLPEGLQAVETRQGTVISKNPAKIAKAQLDADTLTSDGMGELLGYVGSKGDTDGTVVQARDANDNIVWEQATNRVDLDEVAAVAEDMRPEGGRIVATTADKSLAERTERANAPAPAAQSVDGTDTGLETPAPVEPVQPAGVPAVKGRAKKRGVVGQNAAVAGQPSDEAPAAVPVPSEPKPALTEKAPLSAVAVATAKRNAAATAALEAGAPAEQVQRILRVTQSNVNDIRNATRRLNDLVTETRANPAPAPAPAKKAAVSKPQAKEVGYDETPKPVDTAVDKKASEFDAAAKRNGETVRWDDLSQDLQEKAVLANLPYDKVIVRYKAEQIGLMRARKLFDTTNKDLAMPAINKDLGDPDSVQGYLRSAQLGRPIEAKDQPASVWLVSLLNSMGDTPVADLLRQIKRTSLDILDDYRVVFGNPVDDEGVPVAGRIDYREKLITISKDTGNDMTVVHEITHAALDGRLGASPELQAKLGKVMDAAEAALGDKANEGKIADAFENDREFLNYYFTSPSFREAVDTVSPGNMNAFFRAALRLAKSALRALGFAVEAGPIPRLKFEAEMQEILAALLAKPAPSGSSTGTTYQRGGSVRVKLSADEARYFEEVFSSPADLADLTEMAPSVSLVADGLELAQGDVAALEDYVTDTWAAAQKEYGGQGANTVPKSFSFAGASFIKKVRGAAGARSFQRTATAAAVDAADNPEGKAYKAVAAMVDKALGPNSAGVYTATMRDKFVRWGLGILTNDQIVNIFDKLYLKQAGEKVMVSVRELVERMNRQEQDKNNIIAASDKIYRKMSAVLSQFKEEGQRMVKLAYEATYEQIDPSMPLEDQTWLFRSTKDEDGETVMRVPAEKKAKYEEMAAAYAEMAKNKDVLNVYDGIFLHAKELRKMIVDELIGQADRNYGTELANILGDGALLDGARALLRKQREAKYDSKEYRQVRADMNKLAQEMTDAAASVMTRYADSVGDVLSQDAQLKGPYLPLMRRGDFIYVYRSEALVKAHNDLKALNEKTLAASRADTAEAGVRRAQAEGVKARAELKRAQQKLKARPNNGTLKAAVKLAEEAVSKAAADLREASQVRKDSPYRELRREQAALRKEIQAMEADGDQYQVVFSDSEVEVKRLEAEQGGFSIRREEMNELSRIDQGFASRIGLEATKDLNTEDAAVVRALTNGLYLQLSPQNNYLKRQISRGNVAGFSEDLKQNFMEHTRTVANLISKVRHSKDIFEGLEAMKNDTSGPQADREAKRAVFNEMKLRSKMTMAAAPTPIQDFLTKLGAFFYLGITPAFPILNATQGALVTYPMLAARFGGKAAGKAMIGALGDAWNIYQPKNLFGKGALNYEVDPTADGVNLAAGEKQMVAHLQSLGRLNFSIVTELTDSTSSPKWDLLNRFSWHLPHHTEVMNRLYSALAAYRLAIDAGQSQAEAEQFAIDIVTDSHGNYNPDNKPRYLRQMYKPLTLFKSFAQMMAFATLRNAYQSLKGGTPEERSNARWTMAYLAGMHQIFAGAVGLPGMGLMGAVANMFAGDDDEPWEYKTEMRAGLKEVFGDTLGDALYGGVFRLTPFDVGSRIGSADILTLGIRLEGDPGKRGGDEVVNQVFNLLGPVGSIGKGFGEGYVKAFDQGEYLKGLGLAAPKAVGDVIKAFNQGTEGEENRRGVQLQEFGALEVASQLIGITPTSKATAGEIRSSRYKYKTELKNRAGDLLSLYSAAALDGDKERMAELDAEMDAYGEANPTNKITPYSRRRAVSRLRDQQASVTDGFVNEEGDEGLPTE